jgi:TPR repeat protein
MYIDGQGVPKNYVAAYMWYNLAVAQGNIGASQNKDVVKQWMTPEQIAEAERLTQEWLEEHQ